VRRAGRACYIPLAHMAGGGDLFGAADALSEGQIPLEQALDALKPLLEDPR
jgi:DNA polymerase-1